MMAHCRSRVATSRSLPNISCAVDSRSLCQRRLPPYETSSATDGRRECSGQDDAGSCELKKCMAPLLLVMKVLGTYFVLPDAERCCDGNCADASASEKACPASNWLRRYAIFMASVSWANAVRMLSAVRLSDDFFELHMALKIATLCYAWMCVIAHSSLVNACQTRQINPILHGIRIAPPYAKRLRRRCLLMAILSQIILLSHVAFIAYAVFFHSDVYDFMIAPFGMRVPVSWPFGVALKVLCAIADGVTKQGFFLPLFLNHCVADSLRHQFKAVNQRLTDDVLRRRGRITNSLRVIRCRHEDTCRLVRKTDHMLAITTAGAFSFNVFAVVILLYELIFAVGQTEVLVAACTILLAGFACGLLSSTFRGILINHEAHKLSSRVHDIDLAALDDDDIKELMMFEKRLSGEPIGFSVLGIFVITKATLLTLTGMLITYFLLAVQLTPVKVKCTNDALNVTLRM